MIYTPPAKSNHLLDYKIKINGIIFEYHSVKEMISSIVIKIVKSKNNDKIFPYKTTTGKVIVSNNINDIKSKSPAVISIDMVNYYLDVSHPKFYGIRLAVFMLNDAGFDVEYAGGL